MGNYSSVIGLFFLLVFGPICTLEKVLAIDEIVDDYENESMISGKQNIVRNETFNAMELKWGLVKKKDELGYYKDGVFYTTDVLDGVDYLAIVLLLNATIPKKDSIKVEFSQDNSTWSKNIKVISGFQAIDLRDLNYSTIYFRFTFKNGGKEDSTPRLYQLKLIHRSLRALGNGVEPDYTPYMAIAIILLMFGIVVGSRVKR